MRLSGLAGLASVIAPLLALHAEVGAPANKDVVKLGTYVVMNDPWRYAATPGFEILSHCPDTFTENYVRALQRSVAAKYAVLPEDFWAKMPTPVKIILYDKEPAAAGTDIDLVSDTMDGTDWGLLSVLRSSPTEVGDGDTFINCGNYWSVISEGTGPVNLEGSSGFSVDPDGDIRLANHTPKFPSWFEVGLKGPYGVYRSSVVRRKWYGQPVLVLPAAIWISPDETAALKKHSKHSTFLLPLSDLFSGQRMKQHEAIWKSEAALFDRWGLFGVDAAGKSFRPAFINFVRRAMQEPVTEKMFRQCFGLSFAEVGDSLAAYLPEAVKATVMVAIEAPTENPVEIRNATPSEVARMIGDWLRLEGYSLRMSQSDLSQRYLDQAALLFEKTYDKGERDPLFLAAMGLDAVQRGDARARALLEAATKADVVRPKAYLELARLRFQDALPYQSTGIGDLSAAETSAILKLLDIAHTQMPSLVGVDELRAEVLKHAPAKTL